MARNQQWVMSAAEVAEHVAGISPRMAQRAYIVGSGSSINKAIVVTSARTVTAGKFVVDDKDSVEVSKDQVTAYLATQGQRLPARTFMFIRPDPANVPGGGTAAELVITDESVLGRV